MEKQAKVVQLKTQLVKEGHTRELLAETDLMTLRIHCYAPGIGENALHSHTKEDHMFLVCRGRRSSPPDATARWCHGGKKSSGRAPGWLLLSVLQLGQRSTRDGARRRGIGQGRSTNQPRRIGDSRKNP
jgi:hypothetical protein